MTQLDDSPVGASVAGRISIVVPSFNQARFLDEALKSIVEQDYDDVEIIVMDGGSTDASVEVIRRYADRLAYWQSQPDGGQSKAIDAGFRLSTGEFLGWLNSDDRLVGGALSTVADRFRRSDAQWLYGDTEVLDADSKRMEVRRTVKVDVVDLVNLNYYLPQESTFFRRSLYFRSDGVDERLHYAMDYDLWLQFAAISPPHHVDALLGCFRYRPGQKSDDVQSYRAEENLVKQRYGHYVVGRRTRIERFIRLKFRTLKRRLACDGVVPILRKQVRTLRGEAPKLGSSRALAIAVLIAPPGLVVAVFWACAQVVRRRKRP